MDFGNMLGGIGSGLAGGLAQYASKMPTLKERLDKAIQKAEEHLKVLQEAKMILESNPDAIEKLYIVLQKGAF